MTVQYLKKAETNLRAVVRLAPLPQLGASAELPIEVNVIDARGETVFRAVVTMWVSAKNK